MNSLDVRNAFGYLFEEEYYTLRHYASLQFDTDFPNFVNIGAGAGTSGLIFLEIPFSTVTTIDIQDESSPMGCLEGERQAVFNAGLGHLIGDRLKQICGDSKVVGKSWVGDPIELLFIDGDHSYEGCLGDLVAWTPHVSPGGLIIIHDYKKEDDWRCRYPHATMTPDIRERIIKPYPGVDAAVDHFFGNAKPGEYRLLTVVRSLAVFQKAYGLDSLRGE